MDFAGALKRMARSGVLAREAQCDELTNTRVSLNWALRDLDAVKRSELLLAGALQRATRVVKWSAESRRLGAALAARADGCSTHDANSSSPGGTIDAPGSAVVGVGTAS